jgi:hypothetical protein
VTALGNVNGNNISAQGNITSVGNVSAGAFIAGGVIQATSTITGGAFSTTGAVTATGNVSGGNVTTAGQVVATGNVSGGNITTTGAVTATGAINGASLNVNTGNASLGNIVNAGSNGSGNIGSASKYFNTVFATSTSALYADLAEKYLADDNYEPGTVLCFGGTQEVTQCNSADCVTVAGVVSTNPSYVMNAGLKGEHVVNLALIGRVPCRVVGPVTRGAMMVSAGNGQARASSAPAMGTVLGKALENFDGDQGTIEIVIGRL